MKLREGSALAECRKNGEHKTGTKNFLKGGSSRWEEIAERGFKFHITSGRYNNIKATERASAVFQKGDSITGSSKGPAAFKTFGGRAIARRQTQT